MERLAGIYSEAGSTCSRKVMPVGSRLLVPASILPLVSYRMVQAFLLHAQVLGDIT